MIRFTKLDPIKTYATRENAVKAVQKAFGERMTANNNGENLQFILGTNAKGRFFPVFIGERAISAGIHFHFCVAA